MIGGRRKPPMPLGIGRIFEPLYEAVVARRNRSFDRGLRVEDVGRPVISVGNISVGGTGKTPTVAAIVRMLLDEGRRPAIAMRGYRARPGEASDEEAEHRANLGDVPIVARPDRVAGVRELLLEQPEVDCIVLDDGFQHRFVARNLDIVLVDATRDPFHDRCLPAGWLREPVESLARADAVVITHAESADEGEVARLATGIERVHGAPPIAIARHSWTSLKTDRGREAVESLRGRRAYAVCGVGNPGPFVDALARVGARSVGAAVLRDHATYTERIARDILRAAALADAEVVVTTEKDWVKLGPVLRAMTEHELETPVVRPALAMEFVEGEASLRAAVAGAAAGAEVVSL